MAGWLEKKIEFEKPHAKNQVQLMMMAEVAACGETKFRKLAQNAAMKCCAFFEMRFSQG